MPHATDPVALAASLAEILGAFFVAAVAAGCHRSYPRPHLPPWAWSWLAGGASMAISLLALLVPPPRLRTVTTAVILVLRYLQVGALLAGAGARRHATAVSAGRWRVVVGSAIGLGVVSAIPQPLAPWPTVIRGLLPGAMMGIALAWSGVVLGRSYRSTGDRLVAGALLLCGLDRLHRVGLSASVLLGSPVPRYSLHLGFVGFALLTALGVGLVFSLLEDEHRERERAEAERRRRTEELEQEKERLRVSEEKFAKVFRSSPDAIVITDPWEEGRILDVNPSFERLTGHSAQEAVGRTSVELGLWVRPQDRLDLTRVAAEQGAIRDQEVVIRTRAGEHRIFLISGETIEIGGRRCAVNVCRDVTDYRQAEQRFRESEERLRLALDAAGLGTWELDFRTGVVTADAQTDALLGMPTDGLPGTLDAYLAMIHPDDRPRAEAAIRRVVEGPIGDFHVEYRAAAASEPRWLEGKGRVYRDASGEPLMMRGTVADVTARKHAEAALRESEDRWRRISDATFEGIGFSENGVMIDVNPQLAELLGYTTQEMIGKPVWECVAPEDRDRVARAIRSGSTGAYQHLALRKDGTTFQVETRGRGLTLSDRQIRVTAVRDVSEHARLEAELRHRETLAAMGSLVAAVAHEVRTPLFSLSATLDALEAGAGTAAQQQELRDLLRSQVRRLSSLMQDLLDYGRPPKLKIVPGRIHEAVQRAARACDGQARGSSVRIDLDLPTDLPALDADWGRVEQVFHNLIVNAVQHAPRGSAVRVGARPAGDPGAGIALTVEDCGPGVAPSDLDRLFEPFFSRRKGGTGMGLAIAQRLVEAHGGTLTAGNRAGGGAVFTVLLPAAARPTTGGKVA